MDSVFHSLENDHLLLQELTRLQQQQQLQEQQDQHQQEQQQLLQQQAQPSSSTLGQNKSGSSFIDDASKSEDTANIHYLYDVIAKSARPDRIKELQSIVQKFQRSRSKWFNELRIGQERLYDALEKVLIDLKNYTEYSIPFLLKVDKKEVPDYYDVIKKPMDLGTMTKKLNSLQYLSKQQFAEDLYLIWSNCLTYNTNLESIYRKKAIAMKKRTTELLKRVPDITIEVKSAEDHDSESEEDETNNQEEGQNTQVSIRSVHSSYRPESASKKRQRAPSEERDNAAADASSNMEDNGFTVLLDRLEKEATPLDEETNIMHDIDDAMPVETENQPSEADFQATHAAASSGASANVMDDFQIDDHQWHSLTQQIRLQHLAHLESQYQKPFAMRTALIPNPEDFELYEQSLRLHEERNAIPHDDTILKQPEDDARVTLAKQAFLPEIIFKAACLPQLDQPTPSTDPSIFFDDKPMKLGRLGKAVSSNIRKLKEIKELQNKIQDKIAEQSGDFTKQQMQLDDPKPPAVDTKKKRPLTIPSSNYPFAMKQVVNALLCHAGFDAASSTVLDVLTEVGTSYFMNLGSCLRLLNDQCHPAMVPEKMLLLCLQSNGVDNVDKLYQHISVDIMRYGIRLRHIQRKLASTLEHWGSNHLGDRVELDEEELSGQIQSGNFLDESLDWFNLKEMGINVSSIPLELWNRRSDRPLKMSRIGAIGRQVHIIASRLGHIEPKLDIPKAWPPINNSNVIGLLSGYYEKRRESGDMVEDDEKGPLKVKTQKSKAIMKLAVTGRKKPTTGEGLPKIPKSASSAKLAEKAAKEAAREALKRKKEAEKAEKAEKREAAAARKAAK